MKLEVQRAFKRRAVRDRKARERQELNLTRSLQPADRAIRYDDLRSAMAEEGVIRLLMQDDSLFPDQPPLREDEFSSPLLGRIYGELWRCRGSGSSMAALSASLTPEEMSHLTTLLQKPGVHGQRASGAGGLYPHHPRGRCQTQRPQRYGRAGCRPRYI